MSPFAECLPQLRSRSQGPLVADTSLQGVGIPCQAPIYVQIALGHFQFLNAKLAHSMTTTVRLALEHLRPQK